jgi:hypothetical protein
VPIARYFIVVGSALLALLLIAGWSLPEPPPSFPDRPEIIHRANIRIRSDRKWPEKIILDTSQPTIAPPAVNEPPALLVRLPPDEPPDQSNIEAMAQLPPDPLSAAVDHPTLLWHARLDQGVSPKVPLHVSWQERKQTGAVVSLGGSTTVKQAQRPCRAGKPHRHGLWMGRRTP